MNNITIDITDNFAEVSYKQRHVNKIKTISLTDLINAMSAQSGIRVPSLLPAGCRYYVQKAGVHHIYIEVAPMQRIIKYVNVSKKTIFEGNIPLPWTLMHISCVQSPTDSTFTLKRTHIYAMKKPLIDESNELFCYPMANIFSEHDICWGNTFKDVVFSSLSDFAKCIDYYFSSNFNTDIAPRIRDYDRFEDMLRAIQNKNVFPLEILKPTRMSFQDIINNI